MKILLIGYGKMGQAIDEIAISRGHTIVGKVTDLSQLHGYTANDCDIAIEFSHPDAAFDNISYCLKNDIKIISGTTGWLARRQEIEDMCKAHDGTFFYASNYSIGVNIFFNLNEHLARLMTTMTEYTVALEEIHHVHKKDEPSGTAITLAEGVMKHIEHLKQWSLNAHHKSSLPITSLREGEVPGTHIIRYQSPIDDIEIKHTAHSREGFARGAVLVAEWAAGQRGILSMQDFLSL